MTQEEKGTRYVLDNEPATDLTHQEQFLETQRTFQAMKFGERRDVMTELADAIKSGTLQAPPERATKMVAEARQLAVEYDAIANRWNTERISDDDPANENFRSMGLLHDTQTTNWPEIGIDMTHYRSEIAALQDLTEHCRTAIHGAMTHDPATLDADQMAKTKESIVALMSYAKENGLHQATLKLEIIKADLDQRFLTAFGRENEWRMVGDQLNQHTKGALAERLTAAGSNPDLRLAVDFVTKPS